MQGGIANDPTNAQLKRYKDENDLGDLTMAAND
jgi:hypothetical protein